MIGAWCSIAHGQTTDVCRQNWKEKEANIFANSKALDWKFLSSLRCAFTAIHQCHVMSCQDLTIEDFSTCSPLSSFCGELSVSVPPLSKANIFSPDCSKAVVEKPWSGPDPRGEKASWPVVTSYIRYLQPVRNLLRGRFLWNLYR